jgi:hypothetical protein
MSDVAAFNMDRKKILFCAAFAALMLSLAVLGGIRNYSPVPYWDMWDGTIGFFNQISAGNDAAWWAQHNEHRIILARILFWIDITCFGGASYFLITINYLLAASGAYLFWRIIKSFPFHPELACTKICLGWLLSAWLFLWCQQENFTWGFQSQFFLVQLLPLYALYALQRAIVGKNGASFALACGAGVLAAGAMANGVLALPIMTLFAALTRMGYRRIVCLGMLSVGVLLLYFLGFEQPHEHGSLSQSLIHHPLGMLQFICTYLGSPFYYLAGKGVSGRWFAAAMGFIMIVSSVRLGVRALSDVQKNSLTLALLCFVLYIGGTAFGTAGGRLMLGMDVALSSRYTTPAIMAWACLFILQLPVFSAGLQNGKKLYHYALRTLLLLMLVLQLFAVQSVQEKLQEQKLAVLALELGARDERQIIHLFPRADEVQAIAEQARRLKISVFGASPYKQDRESLGQQIPAPSRTACAGAVTGISGIAGETNFQKISGWMLNSSGQTISGLILVVNAQNRIVGYAMSGFPAGALPEQLHASAAQSGFRGYLLRPDSMQGLFLYDMDSDCALHMKSAAEIIN